LTPLHFFFVELNNTTENQKKSIVSPATNEEPNKEKPKEK